MSQTPTKLKGGYCVSYNINSTNSIVNSVKHNIITDDFAPTQTTTSIKYYFYRQLKITVFYSDFTIFCYLILLVEV